MKITTGYLLKVIRDLAEQKVTVSQLPPEIIVALINYSNKEIDRLRIRTEQRKRQKGYEVKYTDDILQEIADNIGFEKISANELYNKFDGKYTKLELGKYAKKLIETGNYIKNVEKEGDKHITYYRRIK